MDAQTIITLVFLFSFGRQPINNLPLSQPRAIHVDINRAIYIADTGNNRIIKFHPDGTLMKTIGGFGWDNEQFDFPTDVCASMALDVFVADYNNQRIERYDKDLHFISSFYSDDTQPHGLKFGYPHAIAVSRHGELFIVDSENDRILKINSFGAPDISFGDFSDGLGKLNDPVQIEVSHDDRIYVTDRLDGRIVVFDYFGNFLTDIGQDMLKEPTGIFIDSHYRIWVTDIKSKQVLTFNKNGNIILQTNGESFKNPMDIISFDKKVYVLDGDIIKVFDIITSPIEPNKEKK